MSDWTKFVKSYAAEYNLSYAASMQQAKKPYQQWKIDRGVILSQQSKQVKPRKEKKQVISSDESSEEEVVKHKKKRQKNK